MLIFLLAAVGCSEPQGTLFQWKPPDFRVKGTYYFQPQAAINTFWSSFDFEQCKVDFAQLRDDGFNTIILFIPWGVFQPTVNPVSYNERAFMELDGVVRLADSFGLKVALRLGTHDHIPRDAGGAKWLAATVMTDEVEWVAYRDLFREVAARTKAHSNLLFLFWTFEDTGYTPDLWFHQYPENVAAFRQWLHRRPLWWWNWLWWEDNASYETVEPPNQNEPPLKGMKLRAFLEFSDQLTARRLPDPCAAAKQGNPQAAVSFQPRAEINWRHDYSLQFELPPCYSFVTTWFSPYQSYIFGDESKELDGKRTASYVPRYLKRTEKLSRGLPVFVDQFNFQHFGGHPEEGALKTEDEQLKFIANGLPPLLRDSLGYALWNYYDYYLNVINNGSFRFGLAEWETPSQDGLVQLNLSSAKDGEAVNIQPGGFVRQKIGVYNDQEYTLDFQARGLEPGAYVRVVIRFLPDVGSLDKAIAVGSQMEPLRVQVKTPPNSADLSITFLAQKGGLAVQIKDVMFYPWMDTGGIYDVEGRPRIELRDLFRQMNALVP
ncbi:MAG: hypothetical protein ACE5MK_13050 [Acidobacteriota bacterium]